MPARYWWLGYYERAEPAAKLSFRFISVHAGTSIFDYMLGDPASVCRNEIDKTVNSQGTVKS